MPLPQQDLYYFIDVTVAHLNQVTGNQIVVRDPTIEFPSLVFSAYTGLIQLRGGAEGFLYLTTSQQFLQNLYTARSSRGQWTEENCRDVMSDISSVIAHNLHKRFGPGLQVAEPRIFTTVPDEQIEMPPAVFVQPLAWRDEVAYLVLGLASAETA
jgi:hypothetical protein